jgi:hypothetical protein
MIAAMATVRGPAAGMAEIAELAAEPTGAWLREYDGYRGLIVLTDEGGAVSRVITLWETAEHERDARASRGAMRDRIAATAGMEVEGMEVYEVPALDLVSD